MGKIRDLRFSLLVTAIISLTTLAQAAPAPPDATADANAPNGVSAKPDPGKGVSAAPSSLAVFFPPGRSKLNKEDESILDRVSRAYNAGKPVIMKVVGNTDLVGNAKDNLLLSQRRAANVLRGLLDRGIPADHFQLVAKGQTEPAVPTPDGVAEAKNRSVVISWH